MTNQQMHSNIPNECYQTQIQNLSETCDNEYYMSALPSATNKERAERGRTRIANAIDEFKKFQQNTKCVACLEEIDRQITFQEEGLKEIQQVWN